LKTLVHLFLRFSRKSFVSTLLGCFQAFWTHCIMTEAWFTKKKMFQPRIRISKCERNLKHYLTEEERTNYKRFTIQLRKMDITIFRLDKKMKLVQNQRMTFVKNFNEINSVEVFYFCSYLYLSPIFYISIL
jgi:hypothetical protein